MSNRIETMLTRDKARPMSGGELANEIQRCRRGMEVGANQAARSRFEQRLHIRQEEADARMAAAGGAR